MAAAVNGLGATGTQAAEPYDLRGVKLGMTLTEFRALPHPDGKPAKVICAGDPETKPLLGPRFYADGDEASGGAIECNYYEFRTSYASSVVPPTWEEVVLNVATVDSFMRYKFVPDPAQNSEQALYTIIVRSNVGNWATFWSGYTSKYGKPLRISNEPTQNNMGATFDNTVAIWENDESIITLIKRFSRIDNTYIFYESKRLSNELKRKVEEKNGRPADKL